MSDFLVYCKIFSYYFYHISVDYFVISLEDVNFVNRYDLNNKKRARALPPHGKPIACVHFGRTLFILLPLSYLALLYI